MIEHQFDYRLINLEAKIRHRLYLGNVKLFIIYNL